MLAAAAAVVAVHLALPCGRVFAALAGARVVPPRQSARVVALQAEAAEAEVVAGGSSEGDVALVRLEEDLKVQIEKAQTDGNPNRLRDLARLLVLAKTAEGIAVKEGTTDASSAVKSAVAESLKDFVGKEEYDFEDVTAEIKTRTGKAVAALDDIYFEDIANEMALASQAAVAGFTGKEDYKFGDISKEIDTRAKGAISAFTGKEDYKFGDISKEAMKRGGDAVKSFTGKEEYKFGDITKTVLKNIFGTGEEEKK